MPLQGRIDRQNNVTTLRDHTHSYSGFFVVNVIAPDSSHVNNWMNFPLRGKAFFVLLKDQQT